MTDEKNEQEIPEPKNVHEAINYVMGRVGYVQKEKGKTLKYTFASETAFIKAVRPHLIDVGLIVFPSGIEMLERSEFEAKSGAQGINILAKFHWTWLHTPTNTSIVVTTLGEAADYGDKAANKAMTAAMKYNMRQTLVIETGDDPDTTPSEDFEKAKKKEAKNKPPKKAATKVKGAPRVKNLWEDNVITTIMDVGLAKVPEHARNTLNHSVLMDVPYGDLTEIEGVAYMMAWEYSHGKYPEDDTEKRADRVNAGYKKFMDQAVELLGGVE